ncbi:MAG: hypothetical protein R2761_08465 [Acidimicrobiales bacterium]
MDTHPLPPPERLVATFADALGLAFELADRHPVGQFVAVADGGHRLVRLAARVPGPGPDVTIDLAGCPYPVRLVRQLTGGRGGLLAVSATACFAPFSPADLVVYGRLRARLARHRITLLDWIRTDGDLYQSAAWATDPPSAWPRDPPGERSAHHGWP